MKYQQSPKDWKESAQNNRLGLKAGLNSLQDPFDHVHPSSDHFPHGALGIVDVK